MSIQRKAVRMQEFPSVRQRIDGLFGEMAELISETIDSWLRAITNLSWTTLYVKGVSLIGEHLVS